MFTSEINRRHIGDVRISVGCSCPSNPDGNGFLRSMTGQYTAENVAFFSWKSKMGQFVVCLSWASTNNVLASNCYLSLRKARSLFVVSTCLCFFLPRAPLSVFVVFPSVCISWLIWHCIIVFDENGPFQNWLSRRTQILWNLVTFWVFFFSARGFWSS